MKRLLILFGVSVIALAALVIPGMAFPTVTEAQSPEVAPDDNVAPDKIDKPTVRLRANGKLGVNWNPVNRATKHFIEIQRPDGWSYVFKGRIHRSVPPSYGFIKAKNITPGIRHRARVKALNSDNIEGEWSEWSEWSTLPPAPAKASKPIFNLRASGWLGVNWHDIQGAVGHEFDLKERAGGTTGAGISTWERYVPWRSSYIFLGRSMVKDGMDYRIRVRAQNIWGLKGAWSDWSDWSGSIVRGAK